MCFLCVLAVCVCKSVCVWGFSEFMCVFANMSVDACKSVGVCLCVCQCAFVLASLSVCVCACLCLQCVCVCLCLCVCVCVIPRGPAHFDNPNDSCKR